MGESKDKAKTKEKKTPFFKGLKAEFNKIIWPDKTTLTKQTAAVVSVILGAIITICDILVKFGVDLLVR
jgi:preprotein translocase subunit SecE